MTITNTALRMISACLICILALLVCFVLPVRAEEPPVQVTIPAPPPLPVPNAFDFYLKAASGIDNDILRVKLQPLWNSPAPQNVPLLDKLTVLALTEGDFATVKQGSLFSYQHPNTRTLQQNYPEYAQFRNLARYLKFIGNVHAAVNDWGGAMDCYLASLHLGSDVQQHANLLGMLVGIAIQTIGRQDCWDTVTLLTAEEAKATTRQLEQLQVEQASFSDIMQEELWEAELRFAQQLNSEDWRTQMQAFVPARNDLLDTTDITTIKQMKAQRLAVATAIAQSLAQMTPQQVMDEYLKNAGVVLAEAKKPYLHPQTTMPFTGKLTPLLMPQTDKARQKQVVNDLESNLLLVTIALQAFRASYGHYPPSLSVLTPSYLTHIPTDPFSDKQPLQYKQTEKGYLLYSIGPDGSNDGGKAIVHTTAPATSYHAVFFKDEVSKGDVVAGVNLN